ncbi:hypothetical protein FB45DRAFT_6491 [Roridomyces roridus]|uniref:BTB domain-containing protein n=1 Tax=Roridomyces roridus TaxID=1738132 RepID=A0AAD7FYG4_9AGAR|nr:hypothetical protein FB45DRAFT_6491 [Roridomyces roridus]
MDGPPVKRQRTDDVEIVRSSEIWHSDGSVVLQAGCTQFRVHWGVLSLHSSVFRDLQGLPQPVNEPKIEGCPVIELSDSSEDVETILNALYDPSVSGDRSTGTDHCPRLFFAQENLPLSIIASHIRLGRKYELKKILPAVTERLTNDYPFTLEGYDKLTSSAPAYYSYEGYQGSHIDVLTLTRENNLLQLLPCVYYRILLAFTQTELFDGVQRPDGTHVTLSPGDVPFAFWRAPSCCQANWKSRLGGCAPTAPSCAKTVMLASKSRTQFSQELLLEGKIAAFPSISWVLKRSQVCNACKEDARVEIPKGRRKMWDLLPSFFGLPAWAELKNDL